MIRGKMPHPCGRCGRSSRGVFVQIVHWRHLVLMSLFRREHVSSRNAYGTAGSGWKIAKVLPSES
jgi:hypothetical protein